MSRHLSLPWRVDAYSACHTISIGGSEVAHVYDRPSPSTPIEKAAEREQIAQVMAAAPQLVTQLRGLLALHVAHHNHPVHAATRALLAELGVRVDV